MEGRYSRIQVQPSTAALGAEVSGVDLAAVDDETFAEIHEAWLEHGVLVFRDQQLRPADQAAFAARFGTLDTYPFIEPLPEHPNVIPIVKERETRSNFGGGWHSDMSYQEKPVKATLLYAIEVPERGGDTLFADMTAAYDSLSEGMKSLLDGLRGVFTAAKVHGAQGLYRSADHPMQMQKNEQKEQARFLHPIVRTHPETGRKALYMDVPHVERLENMRISESLPLMEFLGEHATQPRFTFRLSWRKGTLAVWDNRCVQHWALNDYPGQRREMHRVTVEGDVPF